VPVVLAVSMTAAGVVYPVTDSALHHTSPIMIATLRALVGGVALTAMLPLMGSRLPRTRRLWLWALAIGIGNTTLTQVGISVGTDRAGAAVAAVRGLLPGVAARCPWTRRLASPSRRQAAATRGARLRPPCGAPVAPRLGRRPRGRPRWVSEPGAARPAGSAPVCSQRRLRRDRRADDPGATGRRRGREWSFHGGRAASRGRV
jgi:hypothetical protein